LKKERRHVPWVRPLRRWHTLPFADRRIKPVRDHESFYRPHLERLERRIAPSFLSGVNYPDNTNPLYSAVGDFNGDGLPDIVTADHGTGTSGKVSVYMNQGNGQFVRTDYAAGPFPNSVVVADLKGNGRLDLIVANDLNSGSTNAGTGEISILYGNGDGTFQAPVTLKTGGNSPSVAMVADFNHDGFLDVAVAEEAGSKQSPSGSDVVMFLGTGGGNFAAPYVALNNFGGGQTENGVVADVSSTGYPDIIIGNETGTTSDPSYQRVEVLVNSQTNQPTFSVKTFKAAAHTFSVAVGDFNGDGRPDIATVNNQNPGSLSIFLGTGTSSLYPATASYTYNLGNVQPSSVIAADVNGDGKLDLVITNHATNTVGIMLGNGDGTFQPMRTYAAGGGPEFAAIADFNGDCWTDIAVADQASNQLTVLFNQGGDVFTTSNIAIPATTPPQAVAFGNFNGAKYTSGALVEDMATANVNANTVSVLLGSSTSPGSFSPATTVGFVDAGPVSISAADLNGDGKTDLVTANSRAHDISILLGNGDDTFKTPMNIAVGNDPTSVVAADLNDDGKVDLVVANGGDNTVSVLINNGNDPSGNPTFKTAVTYTVGNFPYRLGLSDMNGATNSDGTIIRDIEVLNQDDSTITVLLNNGKGVFTAKSTTTVDTDPQFLALADYNGDGKVDAVTANSSNGTITYLPGNGDGTFGTAVTTFVEDGLSSVAPADVNGDGKEDLVVSSYYNNEVDVLLGNGDGTFQAPVVLNGMSDGPVQVALRDVNGDGHADIETVNYAGNNLSVLLNTGTFKSPYTLSFAAPVNYSIGSSSNPMAVAVADLNGDGKPDLATANYDSNTVTVVLGHGDGTFQPAQTVANIGSGAVDIVAADLLGNGKTDLLTANYTGNNLSVLTNIRADSNGNPIFQTTNISVGGRQSGFLGPNAVAVGDLNGDGIPDLVTANYYANSVSVLLGTGPDANGNPSYQVASTLTALGNPWYVTLADLNGDGKLDIIVANPFTQSFSVFLNTTPTGSSTPSFAPRQDYGLSDQGPTSWRSVTSTATASSTSRPRTASSIGSAST
jgi:hypothetical protein